MDPKSCRISAITWVCQNSSLFHFVLQHILTWLTLLQVFAKGVDKEMVLLMAATASRLENQDAIDAAIVSMLDDPKEVLDPIT